MTKQRVEQAGQSLGTALQTAAVSYVEMRTKRKTAKDNLKRFRQVHGGCTNNLPPDGSPPIPPCWARTEDTTIYYWQDEQMCDVCTHSQPLWNLYQEAALSVGIALKKLNYAVRAYQVAGDDR